MFRDVVHVCDLKRRWMTLTLYTSFDSVETWFSTFYDSRPLKLEMNHFFVVRWQLSLIYNLQQTFFPSHCHF